MGRQSRVKRERREEKEAQRRRIIRLSTFGAEHGCLFCRENSQKFTSQEHVFPESMGNTELVIPPGVVCDRCNNNVLSQLDQTICDFGPVAMRRTMLGVKSKTGKIPRFRFSEGTLEHHPSDDGSEPRLIVSQSSKRDVLREISRTADGEVKLEWSSHGGRRMTARYASELSRALLKSALECVWIDHGKVALEQRFDHVREAVLGKPRDGYFVMATQADPTCTQASLSYFLLPDQEANLTRVPVFANYYGVMMMTDSHDATPRMAVPPKQASVLTFSGEARGDVVVDSIEDV